MFDAGLRDYETAGLTPPACGHSLSEGDELSSTHQVEDSEEFEESLKKVVNLRRNT